MGESIDKIPIPAWEKVVESKRAIRDAAIAPYLKHQIAPTDPITDVDDVEKLAELIGTGKLKAEEVVLAYIQR